MPALPVTPLPVQAAVCPRESLVRRPELVESSAPVWWPGTWARDVHLWVSGTLPTTGGECADRCQQAEVLAVGCGRASSQSLTGGPRMCHCPQGCQNSVSAQEQLGAQATCQGCHYLSIHIGLCEAPAMYPPAREGESPGTPGRDLGGGGGTRASGRRPSVAAELLPFPW